MPLLPSAAATLSPWLHNPSAVLPPLWQARIEEVREREEKRRREEGKKAEHQQWVEDQKRQLIEARVQRELGRYGDTQLAPSQLPQSQLPGVPYEPHRDFAPSPGAGAGARGHGVGRPRSGAAAPGRRPLDPTTSAASTWAASGAPPFVYDYGTS